jgi:putative ABC transport system permease protein
MNAWVSDLGLDLGFAARTFAKRPGFTAVAVFTLALGIGATAGVFSILRAVLLQPLPYKDPGRLAAVWVTSTREKGLAKIFATYADYVEFRHRSQAFEGIGAATWATSLERVLTGYGPARQVLTIPATASFFETLGVPAALGRTFRREDEGRGCSILVAYNFWASVLAADTLAVGKSLTLDDKPCTILGVMPKGFGFYPQQSQAWILLGPGYQRDQDHMLVGIFARRKPGVTLGQAENELRSLFRALHTDLQTRDFEPVVYDLHGEFTFLAGRTLRTTLILVFAAVLLVLLTACLNVANLLLSRVSDRRRELAVRAALGSGQGRLIRQVLTEGLLLSGASAVLGVAMAWAAVRYFRMANPIELTVGADVAINLPVLGFCIALSIATTLIFGFLPAVRASQVDLTEHLKAGGRGAVRGRHGLAKTVVAVEMALSFMLLIGAGLFMTSALRMGSEPLGFHPDRVLTVRVSLPVSRYSTDSQRLRAFDQLLGRLGRLPGVAGVALASRVPPEAGGNQILEIQGRPVTGGSEVHDTGADAVSPDFFDVLRIPLRRGRAFTTRDRENSEHVAIVNEALAEKYFSHADPLGQQIRILGGAMPWLTIVGVVENLKHTQLMNEMSWAATPILYRPLAQEPRQSVALALRVVGPVGSRAPEVRRQIGAVDASIPVGDVEALSSRLAKALAYPRFRAMVFGFFALAALILSAVGLHGVLSQLVAQRIPEFGLRRAVGAQTRDLMLLVARQGGVPVLAGLAAGTGLTIAFNRILANLLYGIRPADPNALGMVSLLLLAVAGLAIVLPAARAARVDPMVALRDE